MAAEDESVVPTMADVARLAGVSASTVSYALTGARPISAATRERIQHAMDDLGYTPNAFARGLKSKRSRLIALLFPRGGRDLGLSTFEYILGASDHAQELGYHLLLWTTEAEALDELARLAGQGLVDGALLMEVRLRDRRLAVLRKAGLPFAMIGRTADPGTLDFADTDFDQCARLAVDHLAGLGHRRLGFVNLDASAIAAGRGNAIRLRDGVLRAAAASQVQITTLTCESSIGGGRGALAELLARDAAATAVIAFNEQAVPGIMSAATDRGLRIPADFSVLSIDMPAQAALMTTPTMTTVGPTAAVMGRAATAMLIERVEGGTSGATQMLFDGELVLRESTGPASDHDTA
ncbi:LacI family DNA-binding transcriptional regulator [Actinoplanes sp. NPDC051343]|jgi:DNA-binding LacI/PurR family transcriptional regulator|uniref:LacI family DNA-binding transcriptional regulator n=1 Tax=Actinoplanes sp. NPDC051343 TaxID=3363906 RepID=UPI0037B50332